jgi:hypothetical protein
MSLKSKSKQANADTRRKACLELKMHGCSSQIQLGVSCFCPIRYVHTKFAQRTYTHARTQTHTNRKLTPWVSWRHTGCSKAQLILYLGTRCRWLVSFTRRPLYPPNHRTEGSEGHRALLKTFQKRIFLCLCLESNDSLLVQHVAWSLYRLRYSAIRSGI